MSGWPRETTVAAALMVAAACGIMTMRGRRRESSMATQPQRDAAGSGTGLTAASDKAEKLRDAATKHAAKHAKARQAGRQAGGEAGCAGQP